MNKGARHLLGAVRRDEDFRLRVGKGVANLTIRSYIGGNLTESHPALDDTANPDASYH